MELVEGGHLGQLINEWESRGKSVDEDTAKKIVKQVLEALMYLHTERIVHRDIKLANILIDDLNEPNVVKISDFGLSAKHDKFTFEGFTSQCGTEYYKSPEQLKGEVYTKVLFPSNLAHRYLGCWRCRLHDFEPGKASIPEIEPKGTII